MRSVRKNRRFLAGGLISLFFALHLLIIPQAAHAQLAIGADAPRTAEFAVNEARNGIKVSLVGTIFSGLVNLLTFAANRLAYDAAVMLASGGNAEEPLIEYRQPDEFWRDYGAAVAGEAVGLLSEELAEAGGVLSNFNLCAPSNPEVLLSIRVGIRAAFDRPDPRCDFNEIKANWEGYIAQVTSDYEGGLFRNEVILSQLADAFNPETNEFAVGIQLYTDILGKSNLEANIFKDKLLSQGPTKDVTDFITGNVATPASLINHDVENSMAWSKNVGNQVLLTTLNNTDALLQVGLSAASVFTNTLLSQLTNRLYSGLFDFDEVTSNPFDDGFSGSSSREAAQRRFRSILSVAPLEVSNYNILSEFASCPSSSRGLYNCVADTSFISAVARAETGVPLTLEEAIEDDLIDGNWPLISSEDQARDQDPYCYTYGFCHSNLVKLRKARVIPVGWEIAAESAANSVNDPVTIKEVMQAFDDCNDQGELDDNHPWCKLIDPNWVLKYPETQCKALVYGQLLETSASDKRKQECVDMPSCISENEDGTCTGGYGYCVAEENVWRFRGDSCPEYAASCITFEDTEGENSSFLLNTVDYSDCSEENAGCLWYATEKEEQTDGSFVWPTIGDVTAEDAAEGTHESRIYFTAAVEDCDEADGGCAELVERDDDLVLNIIANPSFENDENEDGVPDVWLNEYSANPADYDTENDLSRTGGAAVSPGMATSDRASELLYQEGLVLQQNAFYSFSIYARQDEGFTTADDFKAIVQLRDVNGDTIDLAGTTMSDDCVSPYSDPSDGFSTSSGVALEGTPTDEDYQRYECTFTVPRVDDSGEVYATVILAGTQVYIDDVQLEQNDEASDYTEGYSEQDVTLVYAKVPPAYLGCTGEDTDPDECANYAGVCSETDVGCTEYTPTNGDPSLFAVASALDACPSTCVGYDTFKQEATLYEPEGDFPVYFIPETADTCAEEDIGCDEFTKLDDESLNYFTYLRACVTPDQASANTNDDGAETFYTWEGSDLTGYQLVEWTLLESDMDNVTEYDYAYPADDGSTMTDNDPGSAPCTNWIAGEDGITCDDADGSGALYADSEECNEHDDIFTNPDCREFYDENGAIHYRDWSLTVTVNSACASYRKTDLVGIGEDTDGDGTTDADDNCTGSGGYFDDATSTCRYFGYAAESSTCSEDANGCREYTGGRSRNSRVVIEETFEGGDLTAWDADSATSVDYSNESIATGGHSLASAGETIWSFLYDNGSECEESVEGEGCEGSAQSLGGTCTVTDGEETCGTLEDEFFTGKTYTVSFWAKGTGNLTVGFDLAANPSSGVAAEVEFGTVELSTSTWEEYSLGPLNMTEEDYANFGNGTVLVFEPEDSSVEFYIDTIVVREGEENITIIKDSWVTPNECDETPTGVASPQYYLGCQEYSDQDGETAYLKSFSSLCSEDKVGCDAYYATQESDSAYAEVYNATCASLTGVVSTATDCYYGASGTSYDTDSTFLCTIGLGQSSCDFDLDWYIPESELPTHLSYGPSTEVVPADSALYLIVTDDVKCTDDVAGCTEMGNPTFSADRTQVTESESVWLLNRPDEYAEILCDHDELFCAEWTAESSTYYFKQPGTQTCEYRTDVTVNGTTYDGWFRTGTNNFCYGSGTCDVSGAACSTDADCGTGDTCTINDPSYVIGGDQSGLWFNGDNGYANWVGSCDEQYNGCTEFQDLLDIGASEFYGASDGESYYYLDNESLEDSTLPSSQSCDGQVSQKEGCGLFHDATDMQLTSNASASYIASTHADALFGESPYDLVDPIDCDSGDSAITPPNSVDSVDLCAQRCAYNNAYLYDLSEDYDDTYTFGGSCYSNNDCASYLSEGGETVEGSCVTEYTNSSGATTDVPRLENDSNRVLKVNRDRECSEWLSCASTITVWDERSNSYKTVCEDVALCNEYSSSGNASFCSSWSRDSLAAVLDINTYSERDVSWYGAEYSGYAIPNAFPVELLSQVKVSPPVGVCYFDDINSAQAETYLGNECEDDTDCGGGDGYCVTEDEEEYALVFNAGSCNEDYGGSCTVGYCENTGEACATADECGEDGGSCLVGACRVLDNGADAACTSDADCADNGSNNTCYSGTCGRETIDIPVDDITTTINETTTQSGLCSAAGGSVATSTLTKAGTCIRESCLLLADGTPFEVGAGETQICRGYPEANSPFPNEIVTEWKNPDVTESETTAPSYTQAPEDYLDAAPDYEPYDYVSGFEKVQTCAPGEDCVCSYAKVAYGDTGVSKYYATNSDYPNQEIGVCVGGSYDGSYCKLSACGGSGTEDVICASTCQNGWDEDGNGSVDSDEQQGGGNCEFPTREDTIMGLEGYCLEYDTGINIHGNRDDDHRACLTWLPVDQLAGSTDLYAKHTSAGYDGGDTQYCSYLDVFYDAETSVARVDSDAADGYDMVPYTDDGDYVQIACAESDGSSGAAGWEGCLPFHVEMCPAGYYAIMGDLHDGSEDDGTFAEVCKDGFGGDNDCPYVCVPVDAVKDAETSPDSSVCAPPTSGYTSRRTNDDGRYQLENGDEVNYTTDVYYYEDLVAFGAKALEVQGCAARGRRYYEVYNYEYYSGNWGYSNQLGPLYGFDEDNFGDLSSSDANSVGYYNLVFPDMREYIGCVELVQTDDGNGTMAAPYTDLLLNRDSAEEMVATDANYRYTFDTASYPFGASITYLEAEVRGQGDPYPPIVAQCVDLDTYPYSASYVPTISDDGSEFVCPSGYSVIDGEDVNNPEARAFSGFEREYSAVTWSDVDSGGEGSAGLLKQLFARSITWFAFDDGLSVWDDDWAKPDGGTDDHDGDGDYDVWNEGDWLTGDDADRNYYSPGTEWDVRAEDPNPPKVWALDLANCSGDNCEEGTENALTVNSSNEGNQTASSFFRTYLKFYAAADKNHLPIRRVIVDWQSDIDDTSLDDQTGSTATDNFYKNHRGLQDGLDTSMCDLGTEWGLTSESCDPNYFSYSNIYTCSDADIALMDSCEYGSDGNITNSPCTDGSACYFRPRVHIRDNWGWCTGTCAETGLDEDDSGYCFEGADQTAFISSGYTSECAYQSFPAPSGSYSAIDPWVYYDGAIVVTP